MASLRALLGATASGAALVLATTVLTVVPAGAAPAGTERGGPAPARLYPPSDPTPAGVRHERWAGWYIEWLQEIPLGKNPAVKPGSRRNCATVHGAVFLGPTGSRAGCRAPAGRPLVLTYLAWSCSTAEGDGRAWRKLRRCAVRRHARENGDVRIRLVVDGRRVAAPRRWTTASTREVVRLPRRNLWGVEPGRTRSMAKGIFPVLRPPEPGRHVLRVRMVEDGETTVLRYPVRVG